MVVVTAVSCGGVGEVVAAVSCGGVGLVVVKWTWLRWSGRNCGCGEL